MKQIKAFFQPHRINAVTDALRNSGLCDITVGTRCQNLTVSNVQRLYSSLDVIQQQYSLSLGEPVIGEVKLELFCEDEVIDELAALITQAAKPGPGWVFVSDIRSATHIV